MKKKIERLNDHDLMPINGPHRGEKMRDVPAIYLLSIEPKELKPYPQVAAYIEHAKRQLRDEAMRETPIKPHIED